jgi:hypothetical protein
MFDLAEVDLSRVYVHDGSPVKDVTRVGKHKAIGYVNFSPSPSEMFRPPEINLRQIGEMLESRGMRVYYDGGPAGRGHQQEIADLVRQLPPVRYNRKLRPAHLFLGDNPHLPHTLIAADPVTIERLLAANREALYGFPPTVEAFVDLIRSVWIDLKLPLGKLIRLAFSYYKLYGGREIPRLFEPEQPEPSQPPVGHDEVSPAAIVHELDNLTTRCEQLFAGQRAQLKQIGRDITDAYENLGAYTIIHDHFRAARERNRVVQLISEQERLLEEQEGLLADLRRLVDLTSSVSFDNKERHAPRDGK